MRITSKILANLDNFIHLTVHFNVIILLNEEQIMDKNYIVTCEETIDGYVRNLIPIFKFAVREDLQDSSVSFLPQKGTDRATGWDVRAAIQEGLSISLRPGKYSKIPLGFRAFCPPGWWFEIRPRSSSFAKKQLHSLYGVVDEDYQGELIFACQYIPDISTMGNDLVISFGEAIGQIVPVRRQEIFVEQISNTQYDLLCQERNGSRGEGGFGSTGK